MAFFRTVLGDLPAGSMGVCHAHEHIVIDDGWVLQNWPEFRLSDAELICQELSGLRDLGVATMVDSMPADAGRNAAKMAEVSRRTGMQIIVPTGLHLEQYYPPGHWSESAGADDLAQFFIKEITIGMADPFHQEEGLRAGVIKVAGGRDKLSPAQRRNFQAAAAAQAATGCPILTHTEQGTAALEQIELLAAHGADLAHVCLSHLDRNPDPALHRELLASGVCLEYDSGFRWKGEANPTADLLLELAEEFAGQLMLGMDAAKNAYWRSFGGEPGLDFLVRRFVPALVGQGLSPRAAKSLMEDGPRGCFCFADRQGDEQAARLSSILPTP